MSTVTHRLGPLPNAPTAPQLEPLRIGVSVELTVIAPLQARDVELLLAVMTAAAPPAQGVTLGDAPVLRVAVWLLVLVRDLLPVTEGVTGGVAVPLEEPLAPMLWVDVGVTDGVDD